MKRKRGEVPVTIRDKETSDMVKASAVNLAGNSDAGTRIQVPGYLMHNFRALEAVRYCMKKAGNIIKRLIKYSDNNLDLIMDVKVGDKWMRVNAVEARAVCQENPELRARPKRMGRTEIVKFLSLSKKDSTASGGSKAAG